MEFESNEYRADSVQMRYFTAGKGQSLLFLHGGGVRAMTYRKNLELFAKRFYVIAPDIPPFGASWMPKEVWDFNDYASFFSRFLEHLRLDNLTVVGHSYGGGIALCLAAHSKRVEKLIQIIGGELDC